MSLSILLINTVLTQQTFVGLEDVLKTSSKHVWKRIQHVFSVRIFGLPRRLEDVLQRRFEDVLKTSRKTSCKKDEQLLHWRRLQDILTACLEDVLKTCLEVVFKTCLEVVFQTCLQNIFMMSWRKKKWGYLYLTNRNGYVSNKSLFYKPISDESKGHPESLIRTQWFQYSSYLKIQAGFLFWELKSPTTVWYCEINWIQIQHCRTGETIKTKF